MSYCYGVVCSSDSISLHAAMIPKIHKLAADKEYNIPVHLNTKSDATSTHFRNILELFDKTND